MEQHTTLQQVEAARAAGTPLSQLVYLPRLDIEAQRLLLSLTAKEFSGYSEARLALNLDLAPEVQVEMAETSCSESTRIALAVHPKLCKEAQVALARDCDSSVAGSLLDRSELCVEAQEWIAYTDDTIAAIHLSRYSRLDASVQAILSCSADMTVLDTLARNKAVRRPGPLNARFVHQYRQDLWAKYVPAEDKDTCESLVSNWWKSLDSLIEASQLSRR